MSADRKLLRWRKPRVPVAAYLADVFEWAFAGLFIISSISIVNSGFRVSATMGAADHRMVFVPIAVAWAVSLFLAGLLMIVGLSKKKNAILGVAVERAGLYIATGAWMSLLAVGTFGGASLETLAQYTLVALACFGRSVAIKGIDPVVIPNACRED